MYHYQKKRTMYQISFIARAKPFKWFWFEPSRCILLLWSWSSCSWLVMEMVIQILVSCFHWMFISTIFIHLFFQFPFQHCSVLGGLYIVLDLNQGLLNCYVPRRCMLDCTKKIVWSDKNRGFMWVGRRKKKKNEN